MRRLALLALLIVSMPLAAQVRVRPSLPVLDLSSGTVSGVITSVSGSLVRIADGLIVVDATNAKVTGDLAAGALAVVVLRPGAIAPNAPLAAAQIAVTPLFPITLSGTVTSVDIANRTLTLLGRTIRTDGSTRFSGLLTFLPMTLSDVFAGQMVIVQANVSSGSLLATTVAVIPHIATSIDDPPANQIQLSGLVKSIEEGMWTVGGPPGSLAPDHLIRVTGETKITGNPAVGDLVNIVARISDKGPIVAISITKSPA